MYGKSNPALKIKIRSQTLDQNVKDQAVDISSKMLLINFVNVLLGETEEN